MYPAGTPPPRVDASELRPRRRWYVVAGLIGGILVVAGIGGFSYGVVTAATEGGLGKKFDVGETATVRLTPHLQAAIYVAESAGVGIPDTACTVASTTGHDVRLFSPSYSFSYTRGGTKWHLRYLIHVPAAGEYRVSCRPASGEVVTEHAVGEAPRMQRFVGGLVGGLGSLFILPTIGLAAGGTLAIVVGLRRSNHRRMLHAPRASPPHPPPPQHR